MQFFTLQTEFFLVDLIYSVDVALLQFCMFFHSLLQPGVVFEQNMFLTYPNQSMLVGKKKCDF